MTTTRESDVHDTLVAALESAGERREFADGEDLCREGDESDGAFVVISGVVATFVDGFDGEMRIASHGPGALIGEVTTLIGGLRTATLRAEGPAVIVVVGRAALQRVFDEHPDGAREILRSARERTDRSRVAALISTELNATDNGAIAAIAERVTWVTIRAGETLFSRGDAADAAYLVVSGRLGVTDLGEDETETRVEIPARLPTRGAHPARAKRRIEIGRGGIVGEFGLLEDRTRSATVIALRDTTLARLSALDFRTISANYSAIAMGLVRRILDRSGDDHAAVTSARTFAVVFTAELAPDERSSMVAVMRTALEQCGPTVVLDPTSVDEMLNQPGIAQTPRGGFGEVRLAELLHQSEDDSDHVMLVAETPERGDAGPALPNWTARVLHDADQVVVVTTPNPDDYETAIIERILSATPSRISAWLAPLHPATCTRPSGSRALRERFQADEIIHLKRGGERELGRLARLAGGRGVGLVLSGGGARGQAHIGVYRALTELGIPVDRVVGASMGAIVAGGIGQDLDTDAMVRQLRKATEKLLDYTIPVVSMIKGERIVAVLENQFDPWEIDDLWIPFSCVSTDLTTAHVVVHREGSVSLAIRTSVAIPGVLPPVVHGDHLLADGGILDNLPAGVLADDPSIGTLIASDVAPPLGPRAKGDYGLSVSGWAAMRSRMLPRRGLRKLKRLGGEQAEMVRYPGLGETLMRSMIIGSSKSRDAHLASGEIDLYLDLDLRGVALLDFAQLDEAAERGYAASKDRIAAWLDERNASTDSLE